MKLMYKLVFSLLIASVMILALLSSAGAEGVTEQFNLAPGGTYYFDLSDAEIPGTVNHNLPDLSLRWVPFTYVGTINAYSLDEEADGDIYASDNAVASNRSLFVAEHGVTVESWDVYNSKDLIFGKSYESGGVSYKLRSLSAGNRQRDGYQGALPESNEWDRILEKNAGYIKNWFSRNWLNLPFSLNNDDDGLDNGFSWGQDTYYRTTSFYPHKQYSDRTLRGFYTPSQVWFDSQGTYFGGTVYNYYSLRPALEITSDPTTELKTVTFDMGAYGFLGDKPSLTSATVVYTGTITLPDFITDTGFTYFGLGNGWGKPCWSDGTNFYEMGKEYNLPVETSLTPAYMPVTEQYELNPGGIYYFDLSGQNIPGTVHPVVSKSEKYSYAPDGSLKWVPFLYVGAIHAYSLPLDGSADGDSSASDNAVTSDRSLFVSACDVTSEVSWEQLHAADLIFGKDYQSGGVSYILRSMSMGNRQNKVNAGNRGMERALPIYNEWDQMMDKDGVFNFKLWNGTDWPGPNFYFGQDTQSGYPLTRVTRNGPWGRFRYLESLSSSSISSSYSFRPVLEITSDTSTELKTITFDLGSNGTLGNGMPSGKHDITSFKVDGQVGDSIIDAATHSVKFYMPDGADVTALTPDFTISDNAAISQSPGSSPDFTQPVYYWVKAQNGSEKQWTVTCIVGSDPGGGNNVTGYCHVGDLTDDLTLTSATVVYTGSLTLPEITVANGFNYTGSGSGILGWYDGTTFYAPGTTVSLDSGTTLTAGYSVDAPEVDAGKSTLSAETTPASPTVNSSFTFTVSVRDAAGDPISGLANGDFDITENGAGSLTVNSVTEDGTTGDYTVTASHDTAETINILVEAVGVTITDTLDNVVIQPAPDQSDFTVELVTAGGKTAGEGFVLRITGAKIADGSDLRGDIAVTVTSDHDGEASEVVTVLFTDGEGDIVVTLTKAGDHTLTVTLAGVNNSETLVVSVAPDSVNAGKSTLSAAATPVSPAVNASFTFMVSVRDQYDNPISGLNQTAFTITEDGVGSLTVNSVTEDGATGNYTVNASHDTVETITITVGVSGVTITDIIENVNFLLATPVNGVIAGVAKDNGNNPISGVTVSLSVSGTVYRATTDSNGTYTISGIPAGSGYAVTAGKTGYISQTKENVIVSAGSTTTVNFTMTPSGSGGGGGSSTSAPAAPTYKASVSGANISGTSLPVSINTNTGNAEADLETTLAKDIFSGSETTVLTVPSIPVASSFTLGIPAASLSGSQGEGALTFSTGMGSITIPSGMLAGMPGTEGKKAGITIAQGDKSGLPEEVKAAIGDRPIVQLTLTLDGKQVEWNNPAAPVTVSIPYTPTAAELANPESIVIWYIDGSGRAASVPNGRYDPATGTVTFTTTHFSYYAVSYKQVSFKDVKKDAWYARAVSFIAARDITSGTGDGNFGPEAKLTRGQFIVMLMKAYGIAPDSNPKNNFADAGSTWYTGYLSAAKRLKISAGVGGNLFAPEKEITRQEMFTLLFNALKTIGKLPGRHGQAGTYGRATTAGSDQPVGEADGQTRSNSGRTISSFSDADDIAPWARDAMKLLVETGTIGGSGNRLSPKDTTTRAQMAQVLYSLLSK